VHPKLCSQFALPHPLFSLPWELFLPQPLELPWLHYSLHPKTSLCFPSPLSTRFQTLLALLQARGSPISRGTQPWSTKG